MKKWYLELQNLVNVPSTQHIILKIVEFLVVMFSESIRQKTGKSHLFAVCKAFPTQALYETLCRKIMQPHPSWISMFLGKGNYKSEHYNFEIRQSQIGTMGQMNRQPSVWCSKYFFHEFLQNSLQKSFQFIFFKKMQK